MSTGWTAGWGKVVGRGRWRRQVAVFLVVVHLHDVAHDGRGRSAAPAALLHQRGDHDFGIAARGVADEPAVFFQFLAEFILQLEAFGLRRAGLAGKVDVLKLDEAGGGAIGFVHDAPHSVGHLLDRVIGKREGAGLQARGVLQQVRRNQCAAVRDSGDHSRQLDGRDHHSALSDSHGNCRARIPFVMIDALDPILRWEPGRVLRWANRFPYACRGPGRRRTDRCDRCRAPCRRYRSRRRRKRRCLCGDRRCHARDRNGTGARKT